MPLGDSAGIAPGQSVVASGAAPRVEIGPGLLGRVVDGLCRRMDGLPAPAAEARRPGTPRRPTRSDAAPIDAPLTLGVRALDALMP